MWIYFLRPCISQIIYIYIYIIFLESLINASIEAVLLIYFIGEQLLLGQMKGSHCTTF